MWVMRKRRKPGEGCTETTETRGVNVNDGTEGSDDGIGESGPIRIRGYPYVGNEG